MSAEGQLDEEVEAGYAIKVSAEEALRRYGDRLVVSSLGALIKEHDEEGEIEPRILSSHHQGLLVAFDVLLRIFVLTIASFAAIMRIFCGYQSVRAPVLLD